MKHAGGRPTTYKIEYCEQLVEHMKRGFSFASFGAIADCSEETLHEWKRVHPEFSESATRGRTKSMFFWEDLGVEGTTEGNHFNALSWKFNMQNRFGWKDKQDVTTDGEKIQVIFHESQKQDE
jgi:transposase